MKGEMLEDFDWNGKGYAYRRGQEVEVFEADVYVFNYQ